MALYYPQVTHQVAGNTAGATTSISSGTYILAGGNNITLSQNANSVTISAFNQTNQSLGLYALGNTTGESSSSTFDARTISFIGQGIASVGYSNGSVNISVPAGGGPGDGVNIIAAGTQTANTTGTVMFSNSNNVTFGMSNSSIVTGSASFNQTNQTLGLYGSSQTTGESSSSTFDARSLTFRGMGNVSVGMSASEVVISAPRVSASMHVASMGSLAMVGIGNGTSFFIPVVVPHYMSMDRLLAYPIVSNATNSTGSATISFWAALYTRTGNSLSSVATASVTYAVTYSGTASSSTYGGIRAASIPLAYNVTPGQYWLGFVSSTATAGANASISHLAVSNLNSNFLGPFGVASAGSYNMYPGYGTFSLTRSSAGSAVALSEILQGNSPIWRSTPYLVMMAGTTV